MGYSPWDLKRVGHDLATTQQRTYFLALKTPTPSFPASWFLHNMKRMLRGWGTGQAAGDAERSVPQVAMAPTLTQPSSSFTLLPFGLPGPFLC